MTEYSFAHLKGKTTAAHTHTHTPIYAHQQKNTLRISVRLAQVVCAMVRCSGITRKGTRCTITETSDMIDNSGRLVAQPLRRGGDYCALHAKPFVVRPATTEASLITVFLDLETTGNPLLLSHGVQTPT